MSEITLVPQASAEVSPRQRREPRGSLDSLSPVSRHAKSQQPRLKYVLILGPTGSGKSSLINAVCDEKAPVATPNSGPCTTKFRYYDFGVPGYTIRLVDSPGLGGTSTSSKKVLSDLVNYLMNSYYNRPRYVSAIIYLHPEGSDIKCDSLKNNMIALKAVLGDNWLPHLKVAVLPKQKGETVDPNYITSLQDPASAFHDVHIGGAKILELSTKPEEIRNVLTDCASLSSEPFELQTQITENNIKNPGRYVENILQNIPLQSPSEQSPRLHRNAKHAPSGSTRVGRKEGAGRSSHLERAVAEYEAEIEALRAELEQTRTDYASLRSELQINDNLEQNKLVNSFNDLNRGIEDFGRHMAEHIIDRYIPDTVNHTVLKASNLSQVKALFRHSEGNPSLIMASDGKGMQSENFFDFAVRSILCRRVHTDIFVPFHPSLANTPKNEFVQELYTAVRCQDHPNIAYKWRANTFLGICECSTAANQPEFVRAQITQNIAEDLNSLFATFFGDQVNITLPETLRAKLEVIVSLAWNWNHTLKGSVVVLGDFQPAISDHAVPFDSNHMADFEPDRKKSHPQFALCTVGLGLVSFRSKTKGSPQVGTVVCKTSVVTEHIYE